MRSSLVLGLIAAGFGVTGMVLAFTWDSSRSGVVLILGAIALLVAVVFVGLSVRASRPERS